MEEATTSSARLCQRIEGEAMKTATHKTVRVRIRWAVMTETSFVSGHGGGIAWVYDHKEAAKTAAMMNGMVVDADDLADAKKRAKLIRTLKAANKKLAARGAK